MWHTMKEEEHSELHETLTRELRRGVLVLATLSQLKRARYGYALMSRLAERGLEIEQGTLYPLLRRLESQGLLQSEWDVGGPRPRRYYKISPAGSDLLAALAAEWSELITVMQDLMDGSSTGDEAHVSD
jgi:PadR family transcriptional regulator PadR